MRLLSKILVPVILVLLSGHAALGQDREAPYQRAKTLAASLVQADPAALAPADYRRHAVILADALKSLSYREAALRAADKAAPPSAALLRPGETAAPDILSRAPGREVPLAQVPSEWFNGHLDRTRNSMNQMMGMLDTGTGEPDDLRALAVIIQDQLRLVAHPPLAE